MRAWIISAWIVFFLPVLLALGLGFGPHGLVFVAMISGSMALWIACVGRMLHALDQWIGTTSYHSSD